MGQLDNNNSEEQHSKFREMFKVLKGILTNPLILTVVGGFIAAISANVFAPKLINLFASNEFNLITIVVSTVWGYRFLSSFWNSLTIWTDRANNFRETYCLSAFSSLIYLISLIILGIFFNIVPWTCFSIILKSIEQETFTLDIQTPPSELLLLIVFGTLIFLIEYMIYDRGENFKISDKKYQKTKKVRRDDLLDFLKEGLEELKRKITQSYELQEYKKPNTEPGVFHESWKPILEPTWKDRAKQLYEHSYGEYNLFDNDNVWNDSHRCWIGCNSRKKLIILVVAESSLSKEQQNKVVNYAREITEKSKYNRIEKIIFAFAADEYKRKTQKITEQKLDFFYQFRLMIRGKDETIDIIYETENTLLDRLAKLPNPDSDSEPSIFSSYIREIEERVTINPLPESNSEDKLTLDDVYVASQYLYESTDEKKIKSQQTVENYLQEWFDKSDQADPKQIILLGEYGQGKTSTSLMLTYHLIRNKSSRIPILIQLRGKAPKNQEVDEILSAWGGRHKIPGEALSILHETGRLLLIFEGFDEMELGSNQTREQHFSRLWSFDHPKAKILFTGRPNYFLNDEEEIYNLRLKETYQYPGASGKRIWLAFFDTDRIKNSLRAYKNESIKTQISKLAHKANEDNKERILDILSRPSLLHVVAAIWETENLENNTDLITSANIIKLFIEKTYKREIDKTTINIDSEGDNNDLCDNNNKKEKTANYQLLKPNERDYFMRGIATYMAVNNLENQINGQDFYNLIEQLFDEMPFIKTDRGTLKERIKKVSLTNEEGLKMIKDDVRQFGLLVQDFSTLNSLMFGHKSFMEFLFASTIFNYIQKEKPEIPASILQVTDAEIKDLLKMPVSIDFVAELFLNLSTLTNSEKNNNAKIDINYKRAKDLLIIITGMDYKSRKLYLLKSCLFRQAMKWTFKNKLWLKEYFVIFCSFLSLYSLFWALFFTMMTIYAIYPNFDDTSVVLKFLIIIVFFLLITPIIHLLFFFGLLDLEKPEKNVSDYSEEIILWILLCKKLKIDDHIVHKVAGTSQFSWSNNTPFQEILPDIIKRRLAELDRNTNLKEHREPEENYVR
ncbi:MAG: NACHT domain-containing NTPase [Crocosphaera sp.]